VHPVTKLLGRTLPTKLYTTMANEKDAKLKTLEATIERLDKTYGKGTIMRLGDRQAIEVEVISTGSLGLDPKAVLLKYMALNHLVKLL
jgi:recA bacterial DNA recombination protein